MWGININNSWGLDGIYLQSISRNHKTSIKITKTFRNNKKDRNWLPLHHFRHGCTPQLEIEFVVQCLVMWKRPWWWVVPLIGGPLVFIGIYSFYFVFCFKTSLLMSMACFVALCAQDPVLLALNFVLINICVYLFGFLFIPFVSWIW